MYLKAAGLFLHPFHFSLFILGVLGRIITVVITLCTIVCCRVFFVSVVLASDFVYLILKILAKLQSNGVIERIFVSFGGRGMLPRLFNDYRTLCIFCYRAGVKYLYNVALNYSCGFFLFYANLSLVLPKHFFNGLERVLSNTIGKTFNSLKGFRNTSNVFYKIQTTNYLKNIFFFCVNVFAINILFLVEAVNDEFLFSAVLLEIVGVTFLPSLLSLFFVVVHNAGRTLCYFLITSGDGAIYPKP